MNPSLTPAAERALRAAAAWRDPDDLDALGSRRVLLGLLGEDECRAAQMLAQQGVQPSTVCGCWPGLSPSDPPAEFDPPRLAPALLAALRAAGRRLSEHPKPVELATEHLLLALTLAPSDVAEWLAERGLGTDEVAARIDEIYGVTSDPMQLDEPIAMPAATEIAAAQPNARHATIRILDAAANRGLEALRVIEDYARMALDDRSLTALLKEIRHDLAAALEAIPLAERLSCRDTLHDVGTTISTPAEHRRDSLEHVLSASFSRLKQALRSLEEYGKLIEPALAPKFESLRYRTYTCQKAIGVTCDSATRLADARLYVLVDGRESLADFERLVRTLIDAGVDALQLRDKHLADRPLLERAQKLRSMTCGTKTLMIVNDRPDLALLADADGVHVGQEELTVADVRRVVGPRMLVGVSTHSLDQARQAVLDGANYIGVGPVFPSGTKQFTAFPGPEFATQVAAELRLSAFAIGGIGPSNLAEVLATGIGRVAVGAAVCEAPDPAAVVRALKALLPPPIAEIYQKT